MRNAMQSLNTIGMDVHSYSCNGIWLDARGRERGEWHVDTSVPPLREAIAKTPGPGGW